MLRSHTHLWANSWHQIGGDSTNSDGRCPRLLPAGAHLNGACDATSVSVCLREAFALPELWAPLILFDSLDYKLSAGVYRCTFDTAGYYGNHSEDKNSNDVHDQIQTVSSTLALVSGSTPFE